MLVAREQIILSLAALVRSKTVVGLHSVVLTAALVALLEPAALAELGQRLISMVVLAAVQGDHLRAAAEAGLADLGAQAGPAARLPQPPREARAQVEVVPEAVPLAGQRSRLLAVKLEGLAVPSLAAGAEEPEERRVALPAALEETGPAVVEAEAEVQVPQPMERAVLDRPKTGRPMRFRGDRLQMARAVEALEVRLGAAVR